MKFSQAKQGRTFIIRLEDGDILHQTIEKFADEQEIKAATLIAVGGADKGSVLITGPKIGRPKVGCPGNGKGADTEIEPMEIELDEVHEIAGVGTLFPDTSGKPILHMHIAGGRRSSAVTGCVRRGVRVWHVLEVVLTEIIDTDAYRKHDPGTGFELLEP